MHDKTSALQGTWKGYDATSGTDATCSLVISGEKLEFHGTDKNDWCKGTFTLQEGANPKQIIGVIRECPELDAVGTTVYAIYKVEGNTLTLVGNQPGSPFIPAHFDAPGCRKLILRR
jgi:uncharacterized protein (TIGR03067 family)